MPDWDWNLAGSLASITGLLISIIGFAIAIWRIARSQTAAERAQEAVRGVLHRVTARLFQTNVSACAKLTQDLLNSCSNCQWPQAIDRCIQLRAFISGLLSEKRLAEDEKEYLLSAADDLTIVQDALELKLKNSSKVALQSKNRKTLDQLSIELAKIDGRLITAALEDQT